MILRVADPRGNAVESPFRSEVRGPASFVSDEYAASDCCGSTVCSRSATAAEQGRTPTMRTISHREVHRREWKQLWRVKLGPAGSWKRRIVARSSRCDFSTRRYRTPARVAGGSASGNGLSCRARSAQRHPGHKAGTRCGMHCGRRSGEGPRGRGLHSLMTAVLSPLPPGGLGRAKPRSLSRL